MTQEELNKIVEQHQHWIKQDCEGWEGMRADLSGANLRGANFNGANLNGAIDELKTAHHKERHEYIRMIADLKEKLEDAKATAYADSVDAGMRERKLKRALWLARAEKAKTAKNMFDILWKFASREKVGVTGCAHKIKGAKTLKEPKFFFAKFQIAENKCIEKAEEYK